jgi:predicted PurR-regulated permease PerM
MSSSAEKRDNQVFRRRTIVVAAVLIATAVALWLIFRLSSIIFMVFVSVFVVVAFEPPVHYLAKRGWKRGLATGLVFLVTAGLLVLFFVALAPLFIDQINQLIDSLPDYIATVTKQLNDWFGFDLSTGQLQQEAADLPGLLAGAGGTIIGGVVQISSTIAGFLIFTTTVIVFSFYMIAELPQLQRTVLSTMPEERQRHAMHVWDVAVEKMGGYIYSRLILAILSGIATSIFLSVLGVPFALSLGIWVGVLSQFIPVIGTYLAAILPAVVALSSQGTSTMIWVIVFLVGYQQLENYVISPRITKRTMEIHPAVSIGAILIGSQLLGPIGIILALPMTGIIQALISETRRHHEVILDGGETVAEN